jgi:release factor glutamine methyltransferase
MTSIALLLQSASQRLTAISPTPRLDAELLLAYAIKRSRTYLLAWPEAVPSPAQADRFQHLVERRCQGEPIAYLIGRREFWSHEFEVQPWVLVPRPETEVLVEKALALIPPESSWQIADLGTGSGAIAVCLGLERPKARLIATDLCPKALAVAKANARRIGARNLIFVRGDWLASFAEASLDLIVSNPPYVAATDPHLKGEIRFEPALALIGGRDGMDCFRRLIPQAYRCLKPGGFLLLEHAPEQELALLELLARTGFEGIVCHPDLEGRPRVTQAQRSL